MLNLIHPNSGPIEVLGINPQTNPVETHRQIGYLPGELNLESNLTVEGQLGYFNDLRGNKTDWNFVHQLIEKLELDPKTQIKNLSKGNKQKVGVIQALMGKPGLLLLDEPTSGLDPLMQQQVYQLLKEARNAGATIFFSSHIINEVEAIADRVAIIRKGLIVEEAEPGQLVSMEIRRVNIRFSRAVDCTGFEKIEGVSNVSKRNGHTLTLNLTGEMDNLIKALANYPVRDLRIDHHSLEEAFLTYYKNDNKENN
jgi:ABC-2 type transport system ATP-binding protein